MMKKPFALGSRIVGCSLVLLAVLSAIAPRIVSAAEISGRVYLDANGNGRCDAGEEGVAGCVVSDGVELTATDAEGRYRLELAAGQANVFVVNAPGTWPKDPWWVTLPAGHGDATADFGLVEQKQEQPVVFVHGTDTHVRDGAMAQYDQYIEHVNRLPLKVAFVTHTGDLAVDTLAATLERSDELYALYEKHTAALRWPLRHAIGNHEHAGVSNKNVPVDHPDRGKGMYLRRLGPTSYAFRYGPYHFVALDGTTVDAQDKRGYHDGLTEASAAWTEKYLARVGAQEPVVLMVHQPLGEKLASEQRLLKALKGKRLLLTICGHGHGRSDRPWGKAPMVMGGAVSHTWHGFLPGSPDPFGYVVYRLEGEQIERVYLNWDTSRSFDLSAPTANQLLKGRQAVAGVVNDFDGSLRRVRCRLQDRQADAVLERIGHLKAGFRAEFDVTGLPDGVYDLVLEADDGQKPVTHSRPVVVCADKKEPFAAQGEATVHLRVSGGVAEPIDVLLDGRKLGVVPKTDKADQNVTLRVPADQLARLSAISLSVPKQTKLEVSNVWIALAGKRHCDVRRPPTLRLNAAKIPSGAFYIDHKYDGPRGLMK